MDTSNPGSKASFPITMQSETRRTLPSAPPPPIISNLYQSSSRSESVDFDRRGSHKKSGAQKRKVKRMRLEDKLGEREEISQVCRDPRLGELRGLAQSQDYQYNSTYSHSYDDSDSNSYHNEDSDYTPDNPDRYY